MNQAQLDCAVAHMTGETVATVKCHGFHLLDDQQDGQGDEPLLVVNCPFCGAIVVLSAAGPEELPDIAECGRCETTFSYSDDEIYSTRLSVVAVPAQREFVPAA